MTTKGLGVTLLLLGILTALFTPFMVRFHGKILSGFWQLDRSERATRRLRVTYYVGAAGVVVVGLYLMATGSLTVPDANGEDIDSIIAILGVAVMVTAFVLTLALTIRLWLRR